MAPPVEISVIVPIFNEEESLPILHGEITAALDSMGLGPGEAEVIFVDDCSNDASLHVMLELWRTDERLRVVKFRRNFGQTAAMAAGFDQARGRIVVTLDGDLQNDPADIPRLAAEIDNGFDVVAGWRRKRHDGFILRRLPSIIANRLIALFTGVSIHDTGCTLKAFKRELVKSMSIYAEQHRFLPVLSAGSGAQVKEVVVNHRARRFGESKYGLGRATRVLLDLLTIKLISQFSTRPLQYFGLISFASLLFGVLFAVVALFSRSSQGAGADVPDGLGGVVQGIGEVAGAATSGALLFNDWEMAIITVLLLLFSLFVYFALLGLLGELAVKASGMHRRSTLDRILNELH